jgi:hypothetical protein
MKNKASIKTKGVVKFQYNIIEMPKPTRGTAKDSTELIGNTPMVRLNRITFMPARNFNTPPGYVDLRSSVK